MSQVFRYLAVLLALATISAAYRQDGQNNQTNSDTLIHNSLREVINRGADVYNNDDHAGCYRIFEGALIAIKGQLPHRPELQKVIATALTSAEADPLVWRRAFTLRAALDKLRKELNPKKDTRDSKSPPADKDKDKQEKDKQEKDKTEKDKGDTKPPPPPGMEPEKDKKKDDQDKQKDKKKSDDLQAERLPPPFREELKDGEKKDA